MCTKKEILFCAKGRNRKNIRKLIKKSLNSLEKLNKSSYNYDRMGKL